ELTERLADRDPAHTQFRSQCVLPQRRALGVVATQDALAQRLERQRRHRLTLHRRVPPRTRLQARLPTHRPSTGTRHIASLSHIGMIYPEPARARRFESVERESASRREGRGHPCTPFRTVPLSEQYIPSRATETRGCESPSRRGASSPRRVPARP